MYHSRGGHDLISLQLVASQRSGLTGLGVLFFCLVGVGRRYRFCWCEACEECCGATAQNAPCLPSEHTAVAHRGAGFCRTPCDFLPEDAPYSFGKCARTLSIFVADRLSFFYVGAGGACAQRVARDGSQVVRNPTVVVWAWCKNVRFTYIRVRKKRLCNALPQF